MPRPQLANANRHTSDDQQGAESTGQKWKAWPRARTRGWRPGSGPGSMMPGLCFVSFCCPALASRQRHAPRYSVRVKPPQDIFAAWRRGSGRTARGFKPGDKTRRPAPRTLREGRRPLSSGPLAQNSV